MNINTIYPQKLGYGEVLRLSDSGASASFPEWLKAQREARGLSMNELRKKANQKSHVTISNIEAFKAPFSRKMVVRLATALAPDNATEEQITALVNEALHVAKFRPEDSDDEEVYQLRQGKRVLIHGKSIMLTEELLKRIEFESELLEARDKAC